MLSMSFSISASSTCTTSSHGASLSTHVASLSMLREDASSITSISSHWVVMVICDTDTLADILHGGHIHGVSEKCHPFYFCDNLVRCHSILPILSRNIPREFETKYIFRAHHTSLYMCALYIVKTSNDFYGIQYSVKHKVSSLHMMCDKKSNCHIT